MKKMTLRFAFTKEANVESALLFLESTLHGVESKQITLGPQGNLLLADYLWVRNKVIELGFTLAISHPEAYHYHNLIAQRPAFEGAWAEMITLLKSGMYNRESPKIAEIDQAFKALEPTVTEQFSTWVQGRAKKVFNATAVVIEAQENEIVSLYLAGLIVQLAMQIGLTELEPCAILKHFERHPFQTLEEQHLFLLCEHWASLQTGVEETELTRLSKSYRVNTGYVYPVLNTPILAEITLVGKLVNNTWFCEVEAVTSDTADTVQAIEEAKKMFESDLAALVGSQAGTTLQPIIWLATLPLKV